MRNQERSRVPLYLQVASVIRQRIESGRWKDGDRISTVKELEAEFKVARITVRLALDLLRDEGLVKLIQGKGTFVSRLSREKHWFNLGNDLDSIISSVQDNVVKIVHTKEKALPPVLRHGEGELASAYTQLRSVQFCGGEPFAVVNLRLSSEIYTRDRKSFNRKPALSRITTMSDIDITHALQTVTIGVADLQTSKLLRVGLGEPTADCRLVLLNSANIAIYVAEFQYHRNCFSLRRDLIPRARKVVPKSSRVN